jgi:hypothetical protein
MCRLTFFKVSKPITQGYTSLGRCGFLVTTEVRLLALNLLSSLRTLADIHVYARKSSHNVERARNVSHGGGETCWRCLGGLMPLPSLFNEACVYCGTDTGPTSEVWS